MNTNSQIGLPNQSNQIQLTLHLLSKTLHILDKMKRALQLITFWRDNSSAPIFPVEYPHFFISPLLTTIRAVYGADI